VPTGVTKEDLSQLVHRACADLHSHIDSIHEDVGNCWFVHFGEFFEDKSMIADCILQMRQMNLMGQAIKARLKTEKLYPIFDGSATTASSSVSNEHHELRVDNSRHRNYNPYYGRRFRKPFKRRDENNKGADTTSRSHGPPPEVNDSHFPALGHNGVSSEPRGDAAQVNETPEHTLSSSIVTNTDAEKSEEDKTGGIVATPVEAKKEVHGAYAAALLKASPSKPVDPVKKNVAPVPPKRKVAPAITSTTSLIRVSVMDPLYKERHGCVDDQYWNDDFLFYISLDKNRHVHLGLYVFVLSDQNVTRASS